MTHQLRHWLATTQGMPHALLLAALYIVLLVVLWQLWGWLEGPLSRAASRMLFGQSEFSAITRTRHRIIGWDPFGPLVDPRTHDERRAEALTERQDRRGGLLFCLVVLLGSWIVIGHTDFSHIGIWLVAVCIFLLPLALASAIYLPGLLLKELGYQTGFVHMRGARVTDPAPSAAPGAEVVGTQNIYGPDTAAPLAGVKQAYGGKRASDNDRMWDE